MKLKNIIAFKCIVLTQSLCAQQNPTGACEGTNPATLANSTIPWLRGGNTVAGAGGNDNRFGTCFNSPIFTITNSVYRTRLNGTVGYPVNGFAGSRDGFFLLGQDDNVAGGTLYGSAARGAFSLLHLNGNNSTGFAQELGYRPWMQTGITLTENNDRAYFGYRSILGEANDLVLNWSDNAFGPSPGPDNLVFNFTTSVGPALPSGNTADLFGDDLDGREIMRLTGFGNVGIGPRFNNTFQPTSTLHQHQENAASSWFQITNQFTGGGGAVNAGPTAIAANDGLRLGLLGSTVNFQNGIAMLYQQENRPLLLSSNANTTVATPLATLERIRLMAYNTPTLLPSGVYGVYLPDPTAIPANPNITRMSISHNPTNPITRPLSLLHLGYNTGAVGAGTVDGWRAWMDIGMFTSNGTDNLYIGLKQEPGLAGDRNDAVISWGDNQVAGFPLVSGPDNLRFIFTSTTTGTGGTPPATGANGLETGRFYPGRDTLGTFGRFGVGDFTATGVNQAPTHKIDVVGNGRFRFLPDSIYIADNSVNKIVMVDSLGVLRWASAVPANGIFGAVCGDTVTNAALTADRFLPMNDYNLYFPNQGLAGTDNSWYIGDSCSTIIPSKFTVRQRNDNSTTTFSTFGGFFMNEDNANLASLNISGVGGRSIRDQAPNLKITNIGGVFVAANASTNVGVQGQVTTSTKNGLNVGGFFRATVDSGTNIGVRSIADGTGAGTAVIGYSINTTSLAKTGVSIGGDFQASSSTILNIGVSGRAMDNSGTNYGVFGEVDTTGAGNYAGYFIGDVYISGVYGPSDINMKENIDTIADADSILKQLNPIYFDFKQSGQWERLNLSPKRQMGLIAQEVESILPSVVNDNTHPAAYDSLGIEVSPSFSFKTVDYQKMIPLLISGYKRQNEKIEELKNENENLDSVINAMNAKNYSQDSIINALSNQLNQLANCINSLNLCDENKTLNTTNTVNSQDVSLKDLQAVILDQNVPNPFAEQTTITYTLTENIQRAQLLFYNAAGKLIQTVELANKAGKGEVNVFGNDLSNGIYTYTLVVDGKIIDTKRMVKNK